MKLQYYIIVANIYRDTYFETKKSGGNDEQSKQ